MHLYFEIWINQKSYFFLSVPFPPCSYPSLSFLNLPFLPFLHPCSLSFPDDHPFYKIKPTASRLYLAKYGSSARFILKIERWVLQTNNVPFPPDDFDRIFPENPQMASFLFNCIRCQVYSIKKLETVVSRNFQTTFFITLRVIIWLNRNEHKENIHGTNSKRSRKSLREGAQKRENI